MLGGEFNLLSHVRTVYSIILYLFIIVLLYYNNNRHMLRIKLIFFINEYMSSFINKKFHSISENICHKNSNLYSFIYFCFTFLLFSFQIFFMIYFYFMWGLMLIFCYIFSGIFLQSIYSLILKLNFVLSQSYFHLIYLLMYFFNCLIKSFKRFGG